MKEMRFSKSHEWIAVENANATVGITRYAAEQLGDVVFVELPEVGKKVAAGAEIAVVESDQPGEGAATTRGQEHNPGPAVEPGQGDGPQHRHLRPRAQPQDQEYENFTSKLAGQPLMLTVCFLVGLFLGVGLGSFLCYVYFSAMLLQTEQTLAEKAPHT